MSVLWTFESYAKIEMLPYLPEAIENMIDRGNGEFFLPAGVFLIKDTMADGTTTVGFLPDANEGSVAILAEDVIFYAQQANQPKVVPVITKGYVDAVAVMDAVNAVTTLDPMTEEEVISELGQVLAETGVYLVGSDGKICQCDSSGGENESGGLTPLTPGELEGPGGTV